MKVEATTAPAITDENKPIAVPTADIQEELVSPVDFLLFFKLIFNVL